MNSNRLCVCVCVCVCVCLRVLWFLQHHFRECFRGVSGSLEKNEDVFAVGFVKSNQIAVSTLCEWVFRTQSKCYGGYFLTQHPSMNRPVIDNKQEKNSSCKCHTNNTASHHFNLYAEALIRRRKEEPGAPEAQSTSDLRNEMLSF